MGEALPCRRVIAGYHVQHLTLAIGHEVVRLAIPADIDEVFATGDEPYWAELWPSAIALAEYLKEICCREGRWIELGCGLGLVGLIAARQGAQVLLTDANPSALAFAQDNLRRHQVPRAALAYLDWYDPPKGCRYDGILASDVIYDPEEWEPLLCAWEKLLKPDGEILLAEPGRPDADRFLELAAERAWGWEQSLRTIEWRDQSYRIHIYRFRRHFPIVGRG